MNASQVHEQLKTDLAYQYSIDKNDGHNMCMVLRAYGFKHSFEHAQAIIHFAKEQKDDDT